MMDGRRRLVSRKRPIWLVPKCISMPCSVSWYVCTLTAALLIRMSSFGARDRISFAAERIDVCEERSIVVGVTLRVGEMVLICEITVEILLGVREARRR